MKLLSLAVLAALALSPSLASAHAHRHHRPHHAPIVDRSGYADFQAPRFDTPNFGIVGEVVHQTLGRWVASFYGHGERLNALTSTGERFNPNGFTCAHRSLPFGTKLRVTYHGKSVVVRVNDRGPAAWTGRSLDLAYGAARAIGLDRAGAGSVEVAVLN